MWNIPSLKVVSAFLAWAIFTFLSHFAAKQVFLNSHRLLMIQSVLLVSTFQMGLGAIIFFFRGFVLLDRMAVDKNSMVLGIFQALGVFLTNYSMSATSASLTHLVKMSEPMCTALVMSAIGRLQLNLRVLTILVVTLITALGSEPGQLGRSSIVGLGLAALSNVSYSLRNTGIKYLANQDGKGKTTIEGYAAVSLCGTAFLLPICLLSILLRTENFLILDEIFLNEKFSMYLVIASGFHVAYNIISLTIILAAFNPVQHALLNVAKRISVVIALFIFSNKVLFVSNVISAIVCLAVTVSGTTNLNVEQEKQKDGETTKKKSSLKYGLVLIFGICLYVVGYILSNNYNLPMANAIVSPSSHSVNFTGEFHIVWSYHEPVTKSGIIQINSLAQKVSQDLQVHCGNSECINQMSSLSANIMPHRLNMADKCFETPFQSLIQHHAYYKIVLNDYTKMIQKAAILCTLFKHGGSFVNINLQTPVNTSILLAPSIVNNENGEILMASVPKRDFVIYSLMYHWMEQLPKVPHLKDNQIYFPNLNELKMVNSRPRLDIVETMEDMIEAEPPPSQSGPLFATFMFDQRAKTAGEANAGDEVQGYPGLQFLPRLDVMVDREKLADYKAGTQTIMFGNAWYGDAGIQWPPSKYVKLVLFSLHFGPAFQDQVNTKESIAYLNGTWMSLGSRDEGTRKFLTKLGLKTHFSACATLLLNPTLSSFPNSTKKIVIVDVEEKIRDILIPKTVLPNSVVVSQNIKDWVVRGDRTKRFQYAYSLLNLYSQARVVVTSRIHAALPCVALGIPVLFISVPDSELPGGGGGRTEGLLQLFNVVVVDTKTNTVTNEHDCNNDAAFCYDWNTPPQNPNPELRGRLRASFWNIIRKETALKDTAFMYGMIPLKQFHKSENVLKFNLILSRGNLTYINSRCLESIFWHHPQAQVTVHSPNISKKQDFIDRLSESGYDIQLKEYNLNNLFSEAIKASSLITEEIVHSFTDRLDDIAKGPYWYSHVTDLLRFLIIYLEGGIYIDSDVIITRPFHALHNSIGLEDDATEMANGAVMVFVEKNKFVEECLHEYLTNYQRDDWGANGPKLITRVYSRGTQKRTSHLHVHIKKQNIFYPMKWDEVKPICFESSIKNASHVKEVIENESFAVHLNNRATKQVTKQNNGHFVSKEDTLCRWLLNRFCIFCDEHV